MNRHSSFVIRHSAKRRTTRHTGPLSRGARVHTAAGLAALSLGIAGLCVIASVIWKGAGK